MAEGREYINLDKPVYISHAWTGENRKKAPVTSDEILRKVEEALTDAKLFHVSDIGVKNGEGDDETRGLNYYDEIIEFANKIGRGDAIIAIIDDKYLSSPFCMYEFHCAYKYYGKDSLKEHFFIILLEDAECIRQNKSSINNYLDRITKPLSEKLANKDNFTKIDLLTVESGYYREELFFLNDFLTDTITGKNNVFVNNNFHDVIAKVNDAINGIVPIITQELVNEFLFNKSILLVGDAVFRYVGGNVNMPLNEYIGKKFLKEINTNAEWSNEKVWSYTKLSGFRDWNRKYGDKMKNYHSNEGIDKTLNEVFKSIIDEMNNEYTFFKDGKIRPCNIKFDNFKRFIENSNFDVIISVGFCWHIIEDIIKSVSRWGKVIIKGRDGNTIGNKTDNGSEEGLIRLYILKEDLPYTPKDITTMVNETLYLLQNNEKFKFKNLLALGTDLPGWALRHIWATLSDNGKKLSRVINKQIDRKTKQFLGSPYFVYDLTKLFIEKWNSFALISKQHFVPNGKINIYVFFFKDEYRIYYEKIYKTYLKPYEDNNSCHFIWRTDSSNLKDFELPSEIQITKSIIVYNGCELPSDPSPKMELVENVENICYGKNVLFFHSPTFNLNKETSESGRFRGVVKACSHLYCDIEQEQRETIKNFINLKD